MCLPVWSSSDARAHEAGPTQVWQSYVERSGGSHGEAPVRRLQGDAAADAGQRDMSGAEEAWPM